VDRPPAGEPSHADRARALVAGARFGALATVALEPEGHPFASLVAYVDDGAGHPVLLLSALAEHTRNARADPRASLLVTGDATAGGDPLAHERATLLGRLSPMADETTAPDAGARYLAAHPAAAGYAGLADFAFFRLLVASVRYVGGFGRMGWVDGGTYARAGAPGESRPSGPGRKSP
jgi:putative heme iron utilization protein